MVQRKVAEDLIIPAIC